MQFKDIEVIENLPFAEYQALPLMNGSKLKDIRSNAAQFMWEQTNPVDESDNTAFAIGTALHTLVLEPELFASEIAVFEKTRRSVKDYAAFCEDNEGRTVITKAEHGIVKLMAQAVESDDTAVDLLEGLHEVTVTGTHIATGVRCKGRFDNWCAAELAVVDLKSAKDASMSKRGFPKAIEDYGYFLSASLYADLAQAAFCTEAETVEHIWVVAEKPTSADSAVPPVGVYGAKAFMDIGRQAYVAALEKWKAIEPIMATMKSPNYTDGVMELEPSVWLKP